MKINNLAPVILFVYNRILLLDKVINSIKLNKLSKKTKERMTPEVKAYLSKIGKERLSSLEVRKNLSEKNTGKIRYDKNVT